MQLLQHQIKSIESERDRVLKDMSMLNACLCFASNIMCECVYIGTQRVIEKNDEKTKEVKVKYERQLVDLRTELRSLKSARKEHAKAMKKNVCP